ncbi:M15 family metallopeptidase [Bradyrhizobium sp.]|uniref:M15 family metallopeptidase n=1 Tax=Bradyrhizobium sp. TaxID=376 RepID=UPI002608A398|nr:M15 family metallopeptidase [Bradyrhizobium sp.]
MFRRFSSLGRQAVVIAAAAGLLTSGASPANADSNRITPVSRESCADMRLHKTLRVDSAVECQRLALLKFDYFGFDGKVHNDGELVVLDAAADHVADIFDALLKMHFPIKQARLLNHYDGDDDASMADNNTSAFNDRMVSGGSSISVHAYGLAIDLNPIQNPFLQKQNGVLEVSPKAGERYLNRADVRPGMAEAVVDLFAENGFPIWGGDWKSPIDYQHFQVRRDLARRLAESPGANAKAIFDMQVEQYRRCRHAGRSRRACIAGAPT